MATEFVGTGVAFPLHTDALGALAVAARDRKIEQSVRLILGTAYGERPMRPEFGCGIHDHVFAPADPTTMGRIAYDVRASLRRWEPRIDVHDVDVSLDAVEPTTVYIDIRYSIRGTNDRRNLVFPFYVIPSHE